MPSLGWVLGDEGSGADIGRVLLREALRGAVPQAVMERVFPAGLVLEEAIERTYRRGSPRAWLASLVAPLAGMLDEPFVRQLVSERFSAMAGLLVHYFPVEQRSGLRATGGVAWGFRPLLEDVLGARGLRLSAVERDPLHGLVRWHRLRR
jgi:N-acetylglucosamine kinase-like BadF-type ATPase